MLDSLIQVEHGPGKLDLVVPPAWSEEHALIAALRKVDRTTRRAVDRWPNLWVFLRPSLRRLAFTREESALDGLVGLMKRNVVLLDCFSADVCKAGDAIDWPWAYALGLADDAVRKKRGKMPWADIEEEGRQTLLQWCAWAGKVHLLRTALDSGVSAEFDDGDLMTEALAHAPVVQMLLSHSNYSPAKYGEQAMLNAVRFLHPQIFDLLLRDGRIDVAANDFRVAFAVLDTYDRDMLASLLMDRRVTDDVIARLTEAARREGQDELIALLTSDLDEALNPHRGGRKGKKGRR